MFLALLWYQTSNGGEYKPEMIETGNRQGLPLNSAEASLATTPVPGDPTAHVDPTAPWSISIFHILNLTFWSSSTLRVVLLQTHVYIYCVNEYNAIVSPFRIGTNELMKESTTVMWLVSYKGLVTGRSVCLQGPSSAHPTCNVIRACAQFETAETDIAALK